MARAGNSARCLSRSSTWPDSDRALPVELREHAGIDVDEACAVLEALPDLSKPLANADPELRRRVSDAFQLA
jgi:hypothetical protein